MSEEINIVYEDNHVIVVIKPPNVPTQADESKDEDMLSLVKKYVKNKYKKPGNVYIGLVHRLDRPTGGLLVFAKTSKAASRLSEQLKIGEFDKKYLAVVLGLPKEKTKKLQHYLKKDEKTNTVKIVPRSEEGSKKAELIYNVLDVYSDYIEVPIVPINRVKINQHEDLTEEKEAISKTELKAVNTLSLIEVELITGRSHQIRVQMSSLKTPVYGDVKYGKEVGKLSDSLALWAYRLDFIHPTTKQKMNFTAFPPLENEPWNKFGKFLGVK